MLHASNLLQLDQAGWGFPGGAAGMGALPAVPEEAFSAGDLHQTDCLAHLSSPGDASFLGR